MSKQYTTQQFAQMLENCKHFDSDNRFTGAYDLCKAIEKSTEPLEESLEKRICSAFIQHLEDDSLEVRTNSVRCILLITGKIRESNIMLIVQKLGQEIVTGSSQTLDVFSLTVRGILEKTKDEQAANIIGALQPNLLKGIEQGIEEVKCECLSIFTEMFKHLGPFILRQPSLIQKENLMRAISNQMKIDSTPALRKRASYCLGQFAVILNSTQLSKLCQLLLDRIKNSPQKSDMVTQVQCLSLMSKQVGDKLSPFLGQIVPLLSQLMMDLDEEKNNDVDNELSEACLATLRAVVQRCPRESAKYVPDLFKNALTLLEYDPNYMYDDDNQEMDDDEEEEGWGSDFDDGDEGRMEDDDDRSWLVRRAAVKVIDSIIKTRADFSRVIVEKYAMKLVERFKERIDDVKCDLLEAFEELLKKSVDTMPVSFEAELRSQTSMTRAKSYTGQINDFSTQIIQQLTKQLKSKNLKVRIATLRTLSALSLSIQFQLDSHFELILPELENTMEESQSFEPLLESLRILRRLFRSRPAGKQANFYAFAENIQGLLLFALNHDYSKVVSEGLRVTGSFLSTLREGASTIGPLLQPMTRDFYAAVITKLSKVDIDQEVKTQAVLTAATLVSVGHASLKQSDVNVIIQLFVDRLNNELTRDAALKGLTLIALNEQDVTKGSGDTTLINIENLAQFLPHFFDLMRNVQRQLRLNTLECLEAVTRRYPAQFKNHVAQIQKEVGPLINETDPQESAFALQIAANMIKASPSPANAHIEVIRSAAVVSKSELIQGDALKKLHYFFKVASQQGVVDQNATNLLLSFVSLNNQAAASALALIATYSKVHKNLKGEFLAMSMTKQHARQVIGVLCLGELGKLVDLSTESNVLNIIQGLFESDSEDVRKAASISLGNISVGNPQFFLDKVFALVDKSQDQQKYLFLNTIREIIMHDSKCLEMYVDQLLDLLMSQTTNEDESIRSIVAESLGRLFVVYSEDLIGTIEDGLTKGSLTMKATLAKSIKYAASKHTSQLALQSAAFELLKLRVETDPDIKKNALESLTTIVHNDFDLIKKEVEVFEAFAHQETSVRKELIEDVDLGPFKHKVDKGLPMRKAAFQLLEELFDKASDHVDVSKIVQAVVLSGLSDSNEDSVVLNLHILAKLTQRSGAVVLSQIESIVLAFEKLFQQNLKLVQTKERSANIVRAVVRVVHLINSSEELQETPAPKFENLVQVTVLQNPDAKAIYEKAAASHKNF